VNTFAGAFEQNLKQAGYEAVNARLKVGYSAVMAARAFIPAIPAFGINVQSME
jgi:hypothetical protein